MTIKTKISMLAASAVSLIGTAFAENTTGNNTFNPSLAQGHSNILALPYADKAQWILDTLYAGIDLAAKLALLILVLKIIFGGLDSVEAEIRNRKLFMMIICIVLLMKIGLMAINLVLGW